MKRPTFLQGVGVALAMAFAGAALYTAMSPFAVAAGLLRLIVSGLALAYVVYLLAASPVRTGRFAAFVLWLTAVVVASFLAPTLPAYLLAHVLLIWLVRSLYYRHGLLPALLDGGLSVIALAAGIWAALGTGSLFLALWCFFLVQALFVAIPDRVPADRVTGRAAPGAASGPEDDFGRAYRNAEAAVRRLSTESR